MKGVFLKNEDATAVQVSVLGAFFDLPAGTVVQITNPFRGTKSVNAGFSDDSVAEKILAELVPQGGPTAGQTPRNVRRLTEDETAALVDDDGVITEKEQAKAARRKARPAKREPKRKAATKRKK